jgi:hypothetical protein
MKQLGWTSIEQSKKLVEAGLDPNTADMWYHNGEQNPKPYREHRDFVKSPCWSLGALIGLLPKTIETKKPKNLYFPEILPSSNCVAYTAFNESKEMVFLKMFATGVESDATLIDNMVSMICWLLNNNYIRKEK